MPPIVAPVLVPAAIAFLCLLISWRAWRRRRLAEEGHWGGAAALTLGFLSAYFILVSWPAMPPKKAMDWMPYLVLIAGVAGVTQRKWGKRWYARFSLNLLLGGLFAGVVLRSYLQNTWERDEGILWIAGLAAATTLLRNTLERLATKRRGASLPLSLWLFCAATSVAYTMSGSALLGQLTGALAAVFGAAIVLAWWAPGLSLAAGALTVFAPVYVGLLIQAHFYSELPLLSAVLLYLTPFCLWLGEARRVYYMKPWKAALTRLAIIVGPLCVALWIVYSAMAQYGSGDYY